MTPFSCYADWAKEIGGPQFGLSVSLETMMVVAGLPKLEIE